MKKYLEYFDGAFDSTVVEKIKPENKPYVAYSKTDGVIYTIIHKEDMYTVYKLVKKDISNCTYNMVDLGLPSGTLWADRNVGAASPEDYGSHFQWGDTNAYTYYGAEEITAAKLAELFNPILGPEIGEEITADNIGMIFEQMGITGTDLSELGIISLDKSFNWSSYFDTTNDGNTFNKYNNDNGLTVLESGDDAATAHMGPQYRMPTKEELEELTEYTTQAFIDVEGTEFSKEQAQAGAIGEGKLKGVRFIGNNGNSIFIPVAGICTESLLDEVGISGSLWSSSLSGIEADARFARSLGIGRDIGWWSSYRYYGQSVRGVQP